MLNGKKDFSIIANGLVINGDLVGNGSVEIEGELFGKLVSQNATVSELGKIVGEIYADVANINGIVEGTIRARSIVIASTAKIQGTIEYTKISVENGAVLLGNLKQLQIEEAENIVDSFNENCATTEDTNRNKMKRNGKDTSEEV